MKRHYPTSDFRKYEDGCEFAQNVSGDRELVLRFVKDRSLMGKAYSLELGLRFIAGVSAGALLTFPLARFLDHHALNWLYGTVFELEATLAEAGRMLDLLLEDWKAACVGPAPETPDALQLVPRVGSVTLHEAVVIAAAALASLDPGYPSLNRAMFGGNGGRAPVPRDLQGLEADGRLRSGQAWMLEFANRSTGRLMRVRVPHEGHLQFEMAYRLYLEEPPTEGGGRVVRYIDGAPDRDGLIMLPPAPQHEAGSYLAEIERTLSKIPDVADVIAFADGVKGRDYREKNPDHVLGLCYRSKMLVGAPNDECWELTYGGPGTHPHQLVLHISARPPFKLRWASDVL